MAKKHPLPHFDQHKETIKAIKTLIPPIRRKIIKKLYQEANEREKELIGNMLEKFTTPTQVANFFYGAHIRLIDGGEQYSSWKKQFPDLKQRYSSHSSDAPQYAISGPVLGEALFGTQYLYPDNPTFPKYTWIQLESHPVGALKDWKDNFLREMKNLCLHLLAYLDYKWNKHNIGPHGKSHYTEAKPLTIEVKDLTPDQKQENKKLWTAILFEEPGKITPEILTELKSRTDKPAPKQERNLPK